jgi:hypothetical protein
MFIVLVSVTIKTVATDRRVRWGYSVGKFSAHSATRWREEQSFVDKNEPAWLGQTK